jgi:hypothetical protein
MNPSGFQYSIEFPAHLLGEGRLLEAAIQQCTASRGYEGAVGADGDEMEAA